MKCKNCKDGIEKLPFISHDTLSQATRLCSVCNGTGEVEPIKEVCEWRVGLSGYLIGCNINPVDKYNIHTILPQTCPYCAKPISIKGE